MGIENRGFASMSKAKRKEIAAMGGRKAHELGVAHKWTSETAREAGRIGGLGAKQGYRKATSDKSDAA